MFREVLDALKLQPAWRVLKENFKFKEGSTPGLSYVPLLPQLCALLHLGQVPQRQVVRYLEFASIASPVLAYRALLCPGRVLQGEREEVALRKWKWERASYRNCLIQSLGLGLGFILDLSDWNLWLEHQLKQILIGDLRELRVLQCGVLPVQQPPIVFEQTEVEGFCCVAHRVEETALE